MSLRLVTSTASSSPAANRAQALLGDTPTMTLVADQAAPDSCCTARLVRRGDAWFGVVADRSVLADRVRMGLVPRFFVGDADVVTVAGVARTRLLGRVNVVAADVAAVVAGLIGPWGAGDAVVIEVVPEALVVVDDEAGAGAIPRT
ncbi:MAG TPA: hypothetical protein VGF99_01395 [Myxococcota bacterium]